MNQLKMEVNKILMRGNEADLFNAFDISDETHQRQVCNIHFNESEFEHYGRILVENRLRPF
jgi:hypothetical protein